MTGTCTDKAGNVSAAVPFVFNYDATPPALTAVTAVPDDAGARLAWQASGAAKVMVMRSPAGARGAQSDVVYDGTGDAFTDTGLRNGTRYTYLVQAVDAAGNTATGSASVTPTADASTKHLLSPGAGSEPQPATAAALAQGRAGQLLQRPALPQRQEDPQRVADQAAVPAAQPLALSSAGVIGSWHGTYRWLLWAGYGHRSQHRYGRLLGKRTFVVR